MTEAAKVQPKAEEIARVLCTEAGLDPDEEIVAGQAAGFENFGPRWQAEERSENTLGGRNFVREANTILALLSHVSREGVLEEAALKLDERVEEFAKLSRSCGFGYDGPTYDLQGNTFREAARIVRALKDSQ
jgi:hypothetical protein